MRKILFPLLLALPAAAFAQTMDHASHGTTEAAAVGDSPSTDAYEAAMETMHEDMMVGYTGDADVDFLTGMIPHHQGAVAMAKVVLQYGEDPEVRKLAEKVIATQQAEIDWMQDWLKKNGK